MVAMDNYLNGKNSANRTMNGQSNFMNNYGISELGTLQNLRFLASPVHAHNKESPDWSAGEQRILDDGLIKFAGEPPVMKYVKIAGLLMDKNTRDVAMRCNWMKKQKQCNADQNVTMSKEVPSKENFPSAPQLNVAEGSHVTHSVNHYGQLADEVSGELRDLFRHTRNNIITLLNNLTGLQGPQSAMLPLPLSINEDMADTILVDPTQARMFGSSFPSLDQKSVALRNLLILNVKVVYSQERKSAEKLNRVVCSQNQSAGFVEYKGLTSVVQLLQEHAGIVDICKTLDKSLSR